MESVWRDTKGRKATETPCGPWGAQLITIKLYLHWNEWYIHSNSFSVPLRFLFLKDKAIRRRGKKTVEQFSSEMAAFCYCKQDWNAIVPEVILRSTAALPLMQQAAEIHGWVTPDWQRHRVEVILWSEAVRRVSCILKTEHSFLWENRKIIAIAASSLMLIHFICRWYRTCPAPRLCLTVKWHRLSVEPRQSIPQVGYKCE